VEEIIPHFVNVAVLAILDKHPTKRSKKRLVRQPWSILAKCKSMKQEKILKSFTDLSVELIGVETTKTEGTGPRQSQPGTQEPKQIPRPDSFQVVSPAPGFREWGLND